MKKIIFVSLIVFALANVGAYSQVFTSTDGTSVECSASFKLNVKSDLKMITTGKVIDLGELSPGEVKDLGPDYGMELKLTGEKSSLVSTEIETFSNNDINIKGFRFQTKSEANGTYSESLTFPSNTKIGGENGELWIRIFPEQVSVPLNIEKRDYLLEVRIKCSYINY